MLEDAARNHRSWFGRCRELVELDGVSVFLGRDDAVIAFPGADCDLSGAVRRARASRPKEIGCWALLPDDDLDRQLQQLGFQDGWQPHWLGIDPREHHGLPEHPVEETPQCAGDLPYWSALHEQALGGHVHHFTVSAHGKPIGHTVLNVERESGGIYDMGVAPTARRLGYGRALTLAALRRAREAGCTSVTLNATGEGEPMYLSAGFESLGWGMTWWLFPGRG